jgi:archaellum component FlaG (FlaF/FlaG flagellin family)
MLKGKKMLLLAMSVLLVVGAFSPALADVRPGFERKKIIVKPTFKIDIWVDKGCGGTYKIGDKLIVYFRSSKDAYLNLFDASPAGRVRLIFPNRYRTDNFFEGGRVHAIPVEGDDFEFEVTPPTGKGTIRAMATLTPWHFSPKETLRKGAPFPTIGRSMGEFTSSLKERIAAVSRADRATDTCTYTVTKRMPRYGKIRVTSDPSQARVFLDGTYRGRTPITVGDVTVGEHQIKITKDDYYDWSETVMVRSDRTSAVLARLDRIPRTGSISVTSSPSHARVFLDGEYRGRTPLTIRNVRVGEYQIKVTKEGYYDWSQAIRVRPNVTNRVFAMLEPIPRTGSIAVNSSPRHARVFLDGIERGTTPLTITDINAGWHQVVIIKERYRAYLEDVHIEGGEELFIGVDLRRI